MKKNAATPIEVNFLQSKTNEIMRLFENKREDILNVFDDYFLCWSYDAYDSGFPKESFLKYNSTYVYFRKLIAGLVALKKVSMSNDFVQVIEDDTLQSNTNDLMECLDSDKDYLIDIIDQFYLSWCSQTFHNGLTKSEWNKNTHAYVFFKNVASSLKGIKWLS